MAGNYNFDLHIGDSWPPGDNATLKFQVTSGPTGGPYTAVDLTNATLDAEFRAEAGVGTNVATAVVAKLNQISNPGEFTYRLPASTTGALTPRTYAWGVSLIWAGTDSKLTVLQGLSKASHAR